MERQIKGQYLRMYNDMQWLMKEKQARANVLLGKLKKARAMGASFEYLGGLLKQAEELTGEKY